MMACDTCFVEHQEEDTCPGVTRATVLTVRAQLARLEVKLEAVEEFVLKLAEGHVKGTLQGRVATEILRILEAD